MAASIAILYAAMAIYGVALVVVAVANGVEVFTFGVGASKATVSIWKYCSTNADGTVECHSVTSNEQCSELSSRMKATGSFTVIALVCIILNLYIFFAEGRQRMTLPVNHLSKITIGWTVACLAVNIGIVVGTYVAKLCSNPLALKDQNGDFGPALFCFFAGFVLTCVGAVLYGYFMLKRGDDDEADEAAASLTITRRMEDDL